MKTRTIQVRDGLRVYKAESLTDAINTVWAYLRSTRGSVEIRLVPLESQKKEKS